MIFLIGISHDMQIGKDGVKCHPFIEYVKKVCLESKIDILAEEWNEDSYSLWKITSTTVENVARELKIQYRYCDPNYIQKTYLGIPTQLEIQKKLGSILAAPIQKESSKYHPERELFWYKKIEDVIHKNILFICGSDHISCHNTYSKSGFDTLLTQKGCNVEILPKTFISDFTNNMIPVT